MQNNSDLLDLLKASAPAKSGAGASTTHLGSHAMARVGGTRKVRRVRVRSFFGFKKRKKRGRKKNEEKKKTLSFFSFFCPCFQQPEPDD